MKDKCTFRTQYDNSARITVTPNNGENPVLQNQQEICDLNLIYKQYCLGDKPQQIEVSYGDCTSFPKDYVAAKDLVMRVSDDFLSLPADIRKRFNNNIDEYVKAYGDPNRASDFDFLAGLSPVSADISRPQFAETTQKQNFNSENSASDGVSGVANSEKKEVN